MEAIEQKPIYPIDLIKENKTVPTEFEFYKNNGTTETETTLRGAKSRCGIYPTNNDIIVRIKWLVSGFLLNDKSKLHTLEPIERIVVAISANQTNFKIGDKLVMDASSARPLDIENNQMTLENIIDAYKEGYLPTAENNFRNMPKEDPLYPSRHYVGYDYLILPAVMVNAIISENNL